MSCACCYKLILAECPDAITLQGGLQANTTYYYVITDKFGNQYGKEVESDGDGYITIDANDFPKGYFMNFSGQFELKIYPDEAASTEDDTEIELSLCEQTYSCVIMEFSEDDETYGSVIPDCEQAQTPIADDEIPSTPAKTFCDAVDDCMKVPTANGSYVLKILNGVKSWIAATGGGVWGSISGTLSNQTDLQAALNAKEPAITAGTTSQYWRGDKSWQTLNKSAVGLGNVDNTSDSDKPVSTAQAAADTLVLNTAKSYADTLVVGLIDDRGNYTPSGNYPSSGGSGTLGVILKGDLWTIAGLGLGVTALVGTKEVSDGDLVRALIDTPGQTDGNWAVTENNIGYVAENQSNKTDAMSGNTTSSTKYLSAKGVYDWVIGLGYQVALTAANFGAFINGLSAKTTPVDADAISIIDSADSNNAKKLTWANIKATLKSYFDTLYATTAYADKKRAYLYFSANVISPADSTTYYISFVSNVTNNGTAGAGAGKSLQLGYAAKIVGGAVTVANTTTQGSSEDSTLLIRNVTTSTSSSIGTFKTNASVDGNNSFISKTITGASIDVAATDEIALQWNTPTYATNPAGTRIYGYLIVEF